MEKKIRKTNTHLIMHIWHHIMFVYQSIESLLFEISNKALLRKESEGTLEGYLL